MVENGQKWSTAVKNAQKWPKTAKTQYIYKQLKMVENFFPSFQISKYLSFRDTDNPCNTKTESAQ